MCTGTDKGQVFAIPNSQLATFKRGSEATQTTLRQEADGSWWHIVTRRGPSARSGRGPSASSGRSLHDVTLRGGPYFDELQALAAVKRFYGGDVQVTRIAYCEAFPAPEEETSAVATVELTDAALRQAQGAALANYRPVSFGRVLSAANRLSVVAGVACVMGVAAWLLW